MVVFFNFEIIRINDVLPQPVSPIKIMGTLVLSRKEIKINLIKLSAVKTYDLTISLK